MTYTRVKECADCSTFLGYLQVKSILLGLECGYFIFKGSDKFHTGISENTSELNPPFMNKPSVKIFIYKIPKEWPLIDPVIIWSADNKVTWCFAINFQKDTGHRNVGMAASLSANGAKPVCVVREICWGQIYHPRTNLCRRLPTFGKIKAKPLYDACLH